MEASLMSNMPCGVPQGSSLGPLILHFLTNDLPLALNKTCASMYADDSTIYTSAHQQPQLMNSLKFTETLNLNLNINLTRVRAHPTWPTSSEIAESQIQKHSL